MGSLLRTADGLGLRAVHLTGYTPYPQRTNDTRLPHIATKLHKQIHKTALGAELTVAWEFHPNVFNLIESLRAEGYTIVALEQTKDSISLPSWKPPQAVAMLVGRETEGVEQPVLDACDVKIEIPMLGKKESFNVAQAAAMSLFHTRFTK